jgi:hypothetical protein
MVVVDGSRSGENDADEPAEGSLPLELMGVNDINSGVRTIAQVILAAVRIDPADIERSKRIAGDENARDAFGFGGGWGPGAGARTCHRLADCERPGQAE